MKIITFSGPTSAGKDKIITELMERLNKKFPGQVGRAAYHTTRKLRPEEKQGEGIISISESEFNTAENKGQILNSGNLPGYKVGYSKKELTKAEITLVNIFIELANHLPQSLNEDKKNFVRFYVDAPDSELIGRHLGRETFPIIDNSIARLNADRERDVESEINQAEFRVENKEGRFNKTVDFIEGKILEFLNAK